MEWFKHYIACDHRMNRKPYVLILILFYVASLVLGGVVASQTVLNPNSGIMQLAQEKANGTITEEEYQAKMRDVSRDMQRNISPWVSVFGLLITLSFAPAVAMRLKDVNWPPLLALILPFVSAWAIVMRLSNAPVMPHSLLSIVGIVIAVGEIILIFLPGTRGPNRYGPDPLNRS